MPTQRLYYEDAYIRSFSASVVSCEPGKDGWAVVLDRTAFYPEGGGQPADQGTLGDARVTDVQERGDQVVHTCSAPLQPGDQVTGSLDWPRRFDLMQQHSGEHLVSGVIHARYGWNNVGFHMGSDFITIDFDGPIPVEALPAIEEEVNAHIWEDLPTQVLLPSAQELQKLEYRSKKALEGQVRIVRFGSVDSCACCGTHVRRTGEIGFVKLLSCVKFREGVRIEMLCGRRALCYLTALAEQNHANSVLLSAKPLQTAQAVRRLYDERDALQARLAEQERAVVAERVERLRQAGNVLLVEPGLSADGVRRMAAAVMEVCGGRCAVFSGDETTGYKYAIGQTGGDLRALVRELNGFLDGRGGGKPYFVQGSVRAGRDAIAAFFRRLEKEGR